MNNAVATQTATTGEVPPFPVTDLEIAAYASFSRALRDAPLVNKLKVLGLMAEQAADEVVAFEGQQIDDLIFVADDSGLSDSVGLRAVRDTIAAVFAARLTRNTFGNTFAQACADSDHSHQNHNRLSVAVRILDSTLPQSTRSAVKFLLQLNDAKRLKSFLQQHSTSEAKAILAYIEARRK